MAFVIRFRLETVDRRRYNRNFSFRLPFSLVRSHIDFLINSAPLLIGRARNHGDSLDGSSRVTIFMRSENARVPDSVLASAA